jgi:hypothetical protein
MDFDTAKQRKFDEGRAAHPNTSWTAGHVDARREAQGELCDLYWYADLLKDEVLKVRIHLWCRDIWQELEDMGDEAL